MRSELNVHSPNIKVTVTIGFFVTVLIIFLSVMFRIEFGIILLTVAGVTGSVGLLIVGRSAIKMFRLSMLDLVEIQLKKEELKQAQIATLQMQAQSKVLTFGRTERLLLTEGQDWRFIEAVGDNGKGAIAMAPGLESQKRIDLLSIFTDPHFAYGIIGGQRSGKTWQAMHLANYWVRQGYLPWVIGPKAELGEWPGCKLFVRRDSVIRATLEAVLEEVQKRHASGRGAGAFPTLPVFLDDWMNIHNLDSALAREFIVNASTLFVSAGVIPYFILHSDTREAWGVDNKGATLKDNFFKLFVKAQKDEQGRIATGQSKGFISYPGEAELHEVALFSGSPLVGVAPEIVEGEFSEAEDDVSDDEIFRKLVQEDGFSKSEASQQVYGKPYAGSSHVLRCRQVLNEI